MSALSAGPSARVIGRYVLHGELASGGMATVHLGRLLGEAGFSRTVAIKRLHPQFAKDPEFVAMFVDEARVAARVRHPNVVPTLDVVSEQGEIFLVMEYVHGESLSRLLRTLQKTKTPVSPGIAATIMAGVLHGLHAAHEAHNEKGEPLGIVHRDVSPQNVLVGVDGNAHVLDFGVAKATGRAQTTREGQLKGKISYMAPEQLGEGELTRQSDVYAAGVVLWETLTLRRLFDADNEAGVLMKVIEGKIPLPSKVAKVPPALDAIVMKALDKDPERRWATAREFAVALERSGGVVAASEIGEWVQTIASEELAKRAKKLSEIERGSVRILAESDLKSDPPVAPELAPGESQSGIRIGEPRSQVSTISVTKSEHSAGMVPKARGGRMWFFAGGLAGLFVVVLLLAFTRSNSGPVPSAAAAPPSPIASAVSPVLPMLPTPTASADTRDEPAPANTGMTAISAAPSSASAPPSPPSASPIAASTAPPPPHYARPAKHNADCDPPFTRDAQGHKHYKLQCL